MEGLGLAEAALLTGGGFVAGVMNTLAGGGSLLTVPLLVLLGLPGTLANGTNRVGVLLQYLTASSHFRSQGFLDVPTLLRLLLPVAVGAGIGALFVSRLADETFEIVFGVVMLVMLVPTLRKLGAGGAAASWPPAVTATVFFGIGLYAGAFQAGVGIPTLFALLHAGHDVVRANAIKNSMLAAATLVAVPIFAFQGQIEWWPAAILAVGFIAGGAVGARLAVRGGERVVRPVLAVAVLALAGRMLGLY